MYKFVDYIRTHEAIQKTGSSCATVPAPYH